MILVVDDIPQNVRLLRAVLEPRGYEVSSASSGAEALSVLAAGGVDLVLLDIVMPEMDGYEVCRAIRADPSTAFLPVVMITASGEQEKRRALEAGADDFVTKPFESAELLARVRSLLRIKRYHDGLRRFLPPEVADLVAADPGVLESHRREVAVVSCGLHGFAEFAETASPEDVMAVLDAYHEALAAAVSASGGTLARLAADGVLVMFGDPLPVQDPARPAVRLALSLRDCVWGLAEGWTRLGFSLQPVCGVALGHATIGRIGSASRWEYAPVGPVPLLAERLRGTASPGQVLISQRVEAAVSSFAITSAASERVWDLLGLEA